MRRAHLVPEIDFQAEIPSDSSKKSERFSSEKSLNGFLFLSYKSVWEASGSFWTKGSVTGVIPSYSRNGFGCMSQSKYPRDRA